MKKIKDIQILIWDFDGTLYRSQKKLTDDILEADYEVVMRHRKWGREKTMEEFHKIYKVRTPSSTETAAMLAEISVQEAAKECEEYKDRRPYLSRDEKLISMFAGLTSYTHYMLANGVRQKINECLEVIGLPASTFKKIVTAETVGVNKPQPKGFEHILKDSGRPPAVHLMIGDREAVDLLPAKSLGMRTCLVWHDRRGVVADVTVPDVYSVPDMLP